MNDYVRFISRIMVKRCNCTDIQKDTVNIKLIIVAPLVKQSQGSHVKIGQIKLHIGIFMIQRGIRRVVSMQTIVVIQNRGFMIVLGVLLRIQMWNGNIVMCRFVSRSRQFHLDSSAAPWSHGTAVA